MEKTLTINGRPVAFRATAAVPRLYRIKFGRDIFVDMAKVYKLFEAEQNRQNREKEAGDLEVASMLPPEMLFLFEDVAYIMAKHAGGAAVPDTVESWLDSFETFNIYEILPQIVELWDLNNLQTAKPVKR